jgi:monoamine oxidase
LAGVLGAEIRKDLVPLAASAWGRDPFSRGSYSHACPGHMADRKRLAGNIDGRLFFAGEACSPRYFSTVHGAYETGIAAAKDVLAHLSAAVVT